MRLRFKGWGIRLLRGPRVSLKARLDAMPRGVELLALPLALLVIWLGSSIPSTDLPNLQIFGQDKLIHLAEYTALGLACWVSGRRHWLATLKARCAAAWCALLVGLVLPCALWAASDELHQRVVGRDCSGWDWLADVLGLLLAAWLAHRLERA